MDGQVVSDDEEVDGIEVVLGALGEGKRLSHQAADPLAQGAEPAFDVAGLALVLGAAAVRSGWKSGLVGAPKIAARGTTPPARRQGGAQVRCALFAAVPQTPSHDLAGSSTKSHPEPEGLGFGAHKAPEFIELKHVAAMTGQQRVHEGGQKARFFPPPNA